MIDQPGDTERNATEAASPTAVTAVARTRPLRRRAAPRAVAGAKRVAARRARGTEALGGVAATDATVLIWGASGAERERTARALHECSPRREQSFVKVDCGALPFQLLESEIFGYEPGAFTGAHRRKPGQIEVAHGGTIFLDEIGAMPRALQARLLRVLQDGRVSEPGGLNGARVDVRLVAAATEDLRQLVLRGRLHGELYRWLKTSGIHLPTTAASAEPSDEASPEPSVARRAADGPSRRAAAANPEHEGDGLRAIARRAALEAERAVLKTVLEQVRWNRLEASRRLKISYKTLRWKIRQYGLDGG